jgi:hypothetical protein
MNPIMARTANCFPESLIVEQLAKPSSGVMHVEREADRVLAPFTNLPLQP